MGNGSSVVEVDARVPTVTGIGLAFFACNQAASAWVLAAPTSWIHQGGVHGGQRPGWPQWRRPMQPSKLPVRGGLPNRRRARRRLRSGLSQHPEVTVGVVVNRALRFGLATLATTALLVVLTAPPGAGAQITLKQWAHQDRAAVQILKDAVSAATKPTRQACLKILTDYLHLGRGAPPVELDTE